MKNIIPRKILSLVLTFAMLLAMTSSFAAAAETQRYVLPSSIGEDMVLTREYIYIVEDETVIQQGVTVRAEPGSRICFWKEDPQSDDVASLRVEGHFLVEGTKEEPVYIYPGEQMARYNVELGAADSGYVSLEYADITNLFVGCDNTGTANKINLATRCTFRMNCPGEAVCCRDGSGSVTEAASGDQTMGYINAVDCVFYELTGGLNGSFDRCIFTRCGIDYSAHSGNSYRNCVFLGNSYRTASGQVLSSRMQPDAAAALAEQDVDHADFRVFYNALNGTNYIAYWDGKLGAYLQEAFGGAAAEMGTEDEAAWVAENVGNYQYLHEVFVGSKATQLSCKTYAHTRAMEAGDTSLPELTVAPADATLNLLWTSTDERIFCVENEKLICKNPGEAYLKVKDLNSGLETSFCITVTAQAPEIEAEEIVVKLSEGILFLPEVTLKEGTPAEPVWQVLDQGIAEVMGNILILNGIGTTTLRAIDPRNGLYDEVPLYVIRNTPTEPTEPATDPTDATEPTHREDISIPFSLRTVEANTTYRAVDNGTAERQLTLESLLEKLKTFIANTQYNPAFTGNAVLNPVDADTDAGHWLQVQAPNAAAAGSYEELPMGGNWWGSTDDTAIGLQMTDYTDDPGFKKLMYIPCLMEAPENTFPFATGVKLFNSAGAEVTQVGNEQVTVRVTFNRDMDITIPLAVTFGATYPYDQYTIPGGYVDARTWEGVCTIGAATESGTYYFSISNGCSATDELELQLDMYRFGMTVQTEIRGDMNRDNMVTDADAVYLLRHVLFPERFPVYQSGDINRDNMVTDADAVYLLRYVLFPERFPLN